MMVSLLVCVSSLVIPRTAHPRMAMSDDISRRRILLGGTAGLLLPTGPVLAKSSKVTGSNPAAPGVTVGVYEHGTPSYSEWRKVLDAFIDPKTGQVALPPDQKTIRIIYGKVAKGEKSKEGVMALQVFLDGGLTGVRKFYNQDQKTGGPGGDGQPWAGGRDAGWLVDPWHANYFQPRLFRGLKEGPPPPLKKGMGIIYGGHGLGAGQTFDSWAAGFTSAGADDFHDSCGEWMGLDALLPVFYLLLSCHPNIGHRARRYLCLGSGPFDGRGVDRRHQQGRHRRYPLHQIGRRHAEVPRLIRPDVGRFAKVGQCGWSAAPLRCGGNGGLHLRGRPKL